MPVPIAERTKPPVTVEFVSQTFANASTEINPQPGLQIQNDYQVRYARAVEDAGFEYTLIPHSSSYFDALVRATAITQHTRTLKPIVALRPNILHPTAAATALATLDQVSDGRAVVHFISGGNDSEQAREGDYTDKEQRYRRTREYINILRRAWSSTEPFDHSGEFYRFDDFSNRVVPVGGGIPISFGGSSEDAYRIGGALADIYALWGEPLMETTDQLDSIRAAAAAAGRADPPRVWVTFRPIIAPTEELAWEKAGTVLRALQRNVAGQLSVRGTDRRDYGGKPSNVGSQRLVAVAGKADLHDRALWTKPAQVTGGGGASTALVGTPETVAAAILDYVDLGATIVSLRGYDNLNDVIDYGRYLLPLVRQELAHRAATGRSGEIVAQPPLDGPVEREDLIPQHV
ncbi:MAG: alkanesulfonate monooxygenase [Mycobacterium sp.]|nr:alkanesulfonate monooxygenase [Mycobacterium sp.]